ncbi:MAG: long-chain-acyl-CoA synthetase [Deltaproteobacteria bacterium]|nr:long-chain-acyl-CoA synthetase [Deltaproteobacteria bacterium]
MTEDTNKHQQDLVTPLQYWGKRLSLLRRLPTIIRTARHIGSIAVDNRESWGGMLEQSAARFPGNAAIKSTDGHYTWKAFNEGANRHAHYFISRGLKKGDTAAVFLENRPELLMVYSAMGKIGVCNAMINTNLRLDALRHCLTLNPAMAFIVGEEVLDAFEAVRADLGVTEGQLYFLRDKGKKGMPAGYTDLAGAVEEMPAVNPETTAGVKPADALAYVFTSGTTGGMPKAAVITHGRLVRSAYYNGKIVLDMRPGDTLYVPLPFFHTNALALSWPAVFLNGSAVALRRKFSVSNFWSDVDAYNATAWCYIGELCRYLMNQPPRADDRDHPLTKIIGNGLRPDIWKAFKTRFGIKKVFEIYGAAESNLYFVNLLNLDCTQGTCSLPYSIVAYDVEADEPVREPDGTMRKVGTGEAGLLLGEISADNPFAGYSSKQATESKIIRDVFTRGDAWFNTGDLVRDIGYGHIQFVDRTGDTFRWKGENVSTTEVEKVAGGFDRIALSAVYGVAMPGGDGKAGMVAVVPEGPAEDFDFKGLAVHFMQALPSYAVPKFLRLNTGLALTPTHKIKKVDLKKEGFDPSVATDPLFVLLPGSDAYTPLTADVFKEIKDGKYKF